MQVHRKRMRFGAVLLTLALGAAACGGGDGGDGGDSGQEGGAAGGTFSLPIGDPENPLVPSNTTETSGGAVVDAIWTGLITYDPETTKEAPGVAESIESEDGKTFTVKLKDWVFHDGTPVTSDSFINAWNYGANSANAQGGSYFFAQIDGYDKLQGKEGDPPPPSNAQLSGLKKVDDKTFTITLSKPFRQYPLALGYAAYYPLPDSFFGADKKPGTADDKAAQDAFGKTPVGNGPFKADAEFQPGRGITLSKFEDYSGERKPKVDAVEFRVYADLDTSFTDVQAGNIDFAPVTADAIPTFKDEFGERAIERETSTFQYLGFPLYDERFKDKRVRQAFSMAIDRQGIMDAIFDGSKAPAFSVISPVVAGSRGDACEFCQYKPDEAKALLAETGFDTTKPIDLWFNAGGGHDEWVQAVGNNLRDNLGITYKLNGGLQFAEYLPKADAKGFTGPFRLGWAMDYPSPQNYLEPLYSTAALPPNGSNATFYSNPKFDELVAEGNAAETDEAAIEKYQAAEDLLLEDMPVAPIYFGKGQYVYSERAQNVKVDAFGNVVLEDVTVQ